MNANKNFLRASIDIGTNSCRLLIAEVAREEKQIIYKKTVYKNLEIVKLGEDVNKNKFLKEAAIERTLKVLKKYKKVIDNYSIEEKNVICFATSATRDSSNREYFIEKVLKETGIKILCISGEQEAYINFKGVCSGIKNIDDILVFDIGGGSTEFTLGNKKGIKKSLSLNVGSVRITEKFFLNNGIYNFSDENIKKANELLTDEFTKLEDFKLYNFDLIGVAGTVTTQVSVREKMTEYDSEKIHLSWLSKKDIEENIDLFLKSIPSKEDVVGLEYKRRDVIIGGSIILRNIINFFDKEKLQVSEFDNLMGAILGGLNDMKKNISSYFDDDFINIIYKDIKINNPNFDKDNLKVEERENIDKEIHKFSLKNYELGSIGYTSRELEKSGAKFTSQKYLSNDYNGPNPSYQIAIVKIIFDVNSGKILGFQIANEKNIEKRLDSVKLIMDNNMGIKELSRVNIYSDNDVNPDILNIAALMAINKQDNLVELKEIEVEKIENLVKNNEYLLDVREDYEYNVGHIKGAKNIPLRNIMSELNTLPKDKNIYVYCRSGHRSLDAVSFLNSLGFENVFNVKGGFIELSFNEFKKDEGDLSKSILTNYNFE